MIGPKTTVRGNITGSEDLTIEGSVEGSIRLDGNLSVAESAHLAATLEAIKIDVAGEVRGSINATEALEIAESATVIGDVHTPHLILAEGARFKGRIEMDFEIPGYEPPTAPANTATPNRRR